MKKLIAILLISTFSWSFIKPVAPILINSIFDSVWKIAHNYKMKQVPVRENWLTVLNDIAENNQQSGTKSQPDTFNQINFSSAGIISYYSITYFIGESVKETPPHFEVVYYSVSGKTSTPPPKLG